MLPEAWGRRTKQSTESAGNTENGGSYSFSNQIVYPLMFSLPLSAMRVGRDLWWCNDQLTALWGRLWPVQGAGHEPPPPRCHQWGGCWVRGAGIGLPHAGTTGWGWEALRPTACRHPARRPWTALNPALATSPGSRSRFRRPASSSRALPNGKKNAENVDHAANYSRSTAEANRQ